MIDNLSRPEPCPGLGDCGAHALSTSLGPHTCTSPMMSSMTTSYWTLKSAMMPELEEEDWSCSVGEKVIRAQVSPLSILVDGGGSASPVWVGRIEVVWHGRLSQGWGQPKGPCQAPLQTLQPAPAPHPLSHPALPLAPSLGSLSLTHNLIMPHVPPNPLWRAVMSSGPPGAFVSSHRGNVLCVRTGTDTQMGLGSLPSPLPLWEVAVLQDSPL